MIWTDESNQLSSSKSTLAAQVTWCPVPLWRGGVLKACWSHRCCFRKPAFVSALCTLYWKPGCRCFAHEVRRQQSLLPWMCPSRHSGSPLPGHSVKNEMSELQCGPGCDGSGVWAEAIWGLLLVSRTTGKKPTSLIGYTFILLAYDCRMNLYYMHYNGCLLYTSPSPRDLH